MDVAHGVVIAVLKARNQTREYGVQFSFQFLSFRAAAEVDEQAAPKVGVGEIGEGVFELSCKVEKILGE